ncbi:hypothetical protein E2C01_013910 [Portunus trituberculatus]|uniref:Uncharacterized protein n=1 Tax=Portunus trituberculatus TaxID=210409 RepID=A0A5B7DIP0_PORTR|nr:hypothetical protein [Portunus trituberculatus]
MKQHKKEVPHRSCLAPPHLNAARERELLVVLQLAINDLLGGDALLVRRDDLGGECQQGEGHLHHLHRLCPDNSPTGNGILVGRIDIFL